MEIKAFCLFCLALMLAACQSAGLNGIDNLPQVRGQKASYHHRSETKPTRVPSNEQPIKSISSHVPPYSARVCIKNNMMQYMHIPSNFIAEEQLTDRSTIVLLRNPYSGGEGVYVRVRKLSNDAAQLSLYQNHMNYVSQMWRNLLDMCK